MRDWAKRLNEWVDESGWSVAEYHRRVKANKNVSVSIDAIRSYLKDRVDQPRGEVLDWLAAPFGKTGHELKFGVPLSNEVQVRKFPLIKMNEVGTLKGSLSQITPKWEGPHVDADALMQGVDLVGIEITDNSCAPRLNKGDVVYCELVESSEAVTPDTFVVARVPGKDEGVCGRFHLLDSVDKSRFKIVPENSRFPAYESTPERPVTVIAKIKYRREVFI